MGWFSQEEEEENPTLEYFEEQGKLYGISASSGIEDMMPMFAGALSKFPSDPNLAETSMKYGYSLLSPIFNPLKVGYITSVAKNQGISPEEALAGITIETLQDPEKQPGLIGPILSQGENLGAQGNTTGVYGGVPQLLALIDSIQGTGTQDLQEFFQGLGGILGLGEGDIENVKQAARDVDDKDKFAGLYT